MDTYIYPLLTILYVVLCVVYFRSFRESSFWGSAWILFVMIGFIYQNFIVSISNWLSPSNLEALGKISSLLHVFLLPTLAFFSLDILRRIRIRCCESFVIKTIYHLYTLFVTIFGVCTEYLWMNPEFIEVYGIYRYVSGEPLIPYVTLLAYIPLFVSSLILWRKLQWPILLLGLILTIFGVAISIPFQSSLLQAICELFLIICLVLTEQKLRLQDLHEHLQANTTT